MVHIIPTKSEGNQTLTGTIWSMVERFSKMGIQLLCTLVIAYLIPPSEFGLVSMLTIFLALSSILIDSGFTQAIVHEKILTSTDKSSLFWFNILMGVIIYLLVFAIAPFIAGFYHQPKLTLIIRISFMALLCQSATVVQQALLLKAVNFKHISYISLIAVIISGITGIVIAYMYRNVWGLVVQALVFAIIQTILFWTYSTWRPNVEFSWLSVRKYLKFSLNLLGSNILSCISDNFANLLIGRVYNTTLLGHYTMGNKIQTQITGTLTYAIHRVSYSIMATFQDDNEKLSDYSQKIVGMAFFIIAPIMVLLFIGADDFISILLPPSWSITAHYLRYFCIIGLVYCFSDINQDILLIKGRTDILFRLDIIRRSILTIMLLITIMQNIEVLLICLVVYNILNSFIISYISGRLIDCTLSRQLSYQANTISCSILTAIVGYIWLPLGILAYPILAYFSHNIYMLYILQHFSKIKN